MKSLFLLMSFALLLPTVGCIFPGHREEREHRGHWEERDHDERDHDEHREHSGYRVPDEAGVDVTAARMEALGRCS